MTTSSHLSTPPSPPSAADIRRRVVSFANAVVGLSAAPATYDRYVALIAPAETAFVQKDMSTRSSCGLTVAGIWRATGYYGAALNAPYKVAQGVRRLCDLAVALKAWVQFPKTPGAAFPRPGDMVLIGTGLEEHVYTVVSIETHGDKATLMSVDGGQVGGGYQCISSVKRTWEGAMDIKQGSRREIKGWIDVTQVVTSRAAPVRGLVMGAPPGSKGLDTVTSLRAEDARALVAAGYSFCLRDVSLGVEGGADLTAEEAAGIVGAGLSLMPVQRVNSPAFTPSEELGKKLGRDAARAAQAAGLPMCVNLWLALAGMATSASTKGVIAFCKSWRHEVYAAGFTPGLYVGVEENPVIMSARDLAKLPFQHFWGSASRVPEAPGVYQMIQGQAEEVVCGIAVHLETTKADKNNQRPQMLTGFNAVPPPRQVLSMDMSGPAVKELQTALNTLGASPRLSVNGNFERSTRSAVEEFQRQQGLKGDGVVGSATWGAIERALSAEGAAPGVVPR